MKVTNRTIQNRSKHARLAGEHVVPFHHLDNPSISAFLLSLDSLGNTKEEILFSLGCHLVAGNDNPALRDFLAEYNYETLAIDGIPRDAFDLLGSAYQYLNSKKENLEKGTFYTGESIARDFVGDLDFSLGQTILDPSCGSGSFLFRSNASAPSIFGVDSDPLAVMIAKFNYFIKFPKAGPPNIFTKDFFSWCQQNEGLKFDYVIGNPPYGANIDLSRVFSFHIKSKESFSYFIEYGFRLLRPGGVFRYLLPESLLNVRKHADARAFILDHTNLRRIRRYPAKFASVMSDVFMIELDHDVDDEVVFESFETVVVPKRVFKGLQHKIFVPLNHKDIDILERVNALKCNDLSQSTFGLGVVTGDNSSKLAKSPVPGSEPIYTGKEVEKFVLSAPKNHVVFDRSKLQQVAPDEIYRAPVKLIYKTISKYLKVAFDNSGALTTNSANILIPSVPGYDAIAVMALLNSDLYSFLHFKLFGGVNKIAKENLMALPLPNLTPAQASTVSHLAEEVMKGSSDCALQCFIHEEIFGLATEEVDYIRSVIK
jgi:SAM-dependent methyltransferase